jgi:allantoicase
MRIFPDGGVARLRVYGDVVPDWDALRQLRPVDLAAVLHGGRVVDCSDMFFGSRHNLIMPGPPRGMADGWETKRRRTAGHDWTVVRLGAPGTIMRVEVDTRHFTGNAPAACSEIFLRQRSQRFKNPFMLVNPPFFREGSFSFGAVFPGHDGGGI